MVFCQSCGTQVGDAKYCPQCGSFVAPLTYTHEEERKTGISDRTHRKENLRWGLAIVVSLLFVSLVFGLAFWMAPGEEPEPPRTHGTLTFHLYNEDVYWNGFNVYLRGEGVPNPNALGWDSTDCYDDHVDCYYTGGLDFFGRSATLHADSSLAMYVDLPLGNYYYEIEVNSEVMASGSINLSQQDYQESVSYHYYG